MKQIKKLAACILIAGVGFASCKKSQNEFSQQPNQRPMASAGVDQIIILPANSVVLNGSGSDVDGLIVHYEWINVSGPISVKIENADKAQANVYDMVRGNYEFELKVTDDKMLFAKDRIVVQVLDSISDPLNIYCNGCWDY